MGKLAVPTNLKTYVHNSKTAYVAGFIPQVSKTGLVTIDIPLFIVFIKPFLFPVFMDQKM